MAQESGFDDLSTNYDKVNWIDNDTWLHKKAYDESPFLVLPAQKFNIKLGDTKPEFKCFIRKRGEQFGDSIGLPDLASYTITFKVFDLNHKIAFVGSMTLVDQMTGQIQYAFTKLDFNKEGVYYFEVELKSESNSFTLPSDNIKYEIIVRG